MSQAELWEEMSESKVKPIANLLQVAMDLQVKEELSLCSFP